MFAERLVCLDTLCGLARGRNDLSELLSISVETSSVDFDEALRTCNATFDLMAQCCRLPSREARLAMQSQIDGQLAARINQARSTTGVAKQFVLGGRQTYSRNIADVVCTGLGPEVASCADAGADQQLSIEMVDVAIALAKYRFDHAAYPDRLADLLPKYLDVIPNDPDSRGVLLYSAEGEGYVLYSVGVNTTDDAGDPINDNAFRMPLNNTEAPR